MELYLENIKKSYNGTRAVDGVTLAVPSGKILALVGPSGCGKTTLLRVAAGLVEPDSGKTVIDGRDISGQPPYRRPTATVFQNYALFPHLNVYDNVAYGLKARRLQKKEIGEKVREILSLMRITELSGRKINELSGGQQQRVALARSLVVNPQVLLFDEPLSSLDARLRVEMREEIKRLQQKTGITSIYVTHDQEEALAIAHQVAVMREGKIEQVGSPRDIYCSPQTPFVAGFIGWGNLLEAQLTGHAGKRPLLRFWGEEVSLPASLKENPGDGSTIQVFFRPEQVLPSSNGAWKGLIRQVTFLGYLVRYFFEVEAEPDRYHVMDLPMEQAHYEAGDSVPVHVPPEALIVYHNGRRLL